jgi:GxxExxY protein
LLCEPRKTVKTRKLLYAEEVFRIQGAVFDVYRTMGAGFLESVYQECLGLEFAERRIPHQALQSLKLE